MSTNAQCDSPPRPALPDQLIVKRDHAEVVQVLRKIAEERFTILLDRRHADRRQRVQPVLAERRRGERRTPLAIAAACRYWELCWSRRTAHPPRA